MLLRFKVRSDSIEDFILYIEADSQNSLYQLHETLQEQCRFDPSQLATFFTADEEWDPDFEIKMFGNSVNETPYQSRSMKNTALGEIIKTTDDKLLYIFDICNEKSLYLELFEIDMKKSINHPVVTLHKGVVPAQTSFINSEGDFDGNDDPASQHIYDDLGELEDLYTIYGEMSNNIL